MYKSAFFRSEEKNEPNKKNRKVNKEEKILIQAIKNIRHDSFKDKLEEEQKGNVSEEAIGEALNKFIDDLMASDEIWAEMLETFKSQKIEKERKNFARGDYSPSTHTQTQTKS